MGNSQKKPLRANYYIILATLDQDDSVESSFFENFGKITFTRLFVDLFIWLKGKVKLYQFDYKIA